MKTRPTHILRTRKGFTLIEILVVISIIVILVATVLAIGTNVRANAQIRQTKVTLASLQAALEKYLEEGHRIPSSGATDYYTRFRSVPEIWKAVQNLPNNGTQFIDGFGKEIYFVAPTTDSQGDKNGFFRSYGPNGNADTDDIYSYDPM